MNVYETVFGNDDEANDIYADCASRHPSYHWPKALPPEMYDRSIYNCILCELRKGENQGVSEAVDLVSYPEELSKVHGFIILCADIMGMVGHGDTAEEAMTDLRCGIIYRLCDNDGGIYVGTSDYAFQEAELLTFEDTLAIDEVYIVHKTHVQLAVVEEYPRYCD